MEDSEINTKPAVLPLKVNKK